MRLREGSSPCIGAEAGAAPSLIADFYAAVLPAVQPMKLALGMATVPLLAPLLLLLVHPAKPASVAVLARLSRLPHSSKRPVRGVDVAGLTTRRSRVDTKKP